MRASQCYFFLICKLILTICQAGRCFCGNLQATCDELIPWVHSGRQLAIKWRMENYEQHIGSFRRHHKRQRLVIKSWPTYRIQARISFGKCFFICKDCNLTIFHLNQAKRRQLAKLAMTNCPKDVLAMNADLVCCVSRCRCQIWVSWGMKFIASPEKALKMSAFCLFFPSSFK